MQTFTTLKKFASSQKRVELIEFHSKKCILKQCDDEQKIKQEVTLMNTIAGTGYAPKVVCSQDKYIIYEYVEGEDFSQLFRKATMLDDKVMLEDLAKKLCIFMQMFHSISNGIILNNVNFSNFIMRDDRCVGVDFYDAKEGMPYEDVAGVIAYSLCNAIGNYYSCFPFAFKMLECYHLSVMDIINELREQLKALQNTFRHIDKDMFIDALISYEENCSVWNLVN